MYYDLLYSLRLLKYLYDIGAYERVAGNIDRITGDDYFELVMLGLENVAEEYYAEEAGEDVCCGGHVIHHFSDPALIEYYRLCRLYESKHSIGPEKNPYVIDADRFYEWCLDNMHGAIATHYDDERRPREILIETCPENSFFEHELLILVHSLMDFYRVKADDIRAELLKGPTFWLPELPPHKAPGRAAAEGIIHKRAPRANNDDLMKAS